MASPTCSTGSEPRRPVGAAVSARHNPHEVAATVIGREEELGASRRFWQTPDGAARASSLRRGGNRQDRALGGGCRGRAQRFGSVLTCRGVEAEASLSFTGLSELLGDVLDEVGPSLAPPRRRALEVALLLVEPGETAPDPHAIGLAVLDVLRALVRAGTGPRRARRRPVARPCVGGRAPDRVPASSRGADRAAGHAEAGTGDGEPGRARALVPERAARAADRRPADARRACTACSRSGSGSS